MTPRAALRRLAAAALLGLGFWLAATAALSIAPTRPAAAVAEGPAPGYTGGFGEPTCTTCHFDAPAEPDEGGLTVAGVPACYRPGARYALTVELRDPRLERAGFQLAARFADGGQAGRLAADGARAEVVEHGEPPVLYARQTLAGARLEDSGRAAWTLHWTAPAEARGAVDFHAAGNAANDDDSELGDIVHTRAARSAPGCR